MPHIFRPRKDPITLPIQMSCWGITDSSRAVTLLGKSRPIDMEAHLHPCLLTQKVRKFVTKLQSPHSHSIPQSTHKLVSMDQPGSQAVEILHIYIAVILPLSLYVQNFWQRSLKAFCLSSLGFGLGLALKKVTFTFLPQMMETLKLRIMPLHPLPFTPAKVFFISLGRLNFHHVLPSSSSQLPGASHNQPKPPKAGAAEMCTRYAFGCVYQTQPGSCGWSKESGCSGDPGLPATCPSGLKRWNLPLSSAFHLLLWAQAKTLPVVLQFPHLWGMVSLFHTGHCAFYSSPFTCGFRLIPLQPVM